LSNGAELSDSKSKKARRSTLHSWLESNGIFCLLIHGVVQQCVAIRCDEKLFRRPRPKIERPNYINGIIRHAAGPGFVERPECLEPRADYKVHQDPVHVTLETRQRRMEREDSRYSWRSAQEPTDRYMIREDSRLRSVVRHVREPRFVERQRQEHRRDFRQHREPRDVTRRSSRSDAINRHDPEQNRRRSRWQNDNSDDGWRTWVNTRMQN